MTSRSNRGGGSEHVFGVATRGGEGRLRGGGEHDRRGRAEGLGRGLGGLDVCTGGAPIAPGGGHERHATANVAAGPGVRAAFSVVSVSPGEVVLGASQSVPAGARAQRFIWSTGSCGPAAVCQGTEPKLEMFTRSRFTGTLSMTAIDANGATATSALDWLTIPAPRTVLATGPLRSAGVTSPRFGTLDVCEGLAPLSTVTQAPGPGGSPPPACTEDVEFGAVDAAGCLYPEDDLSQLQGGSARVIAGLLCHHSEFFCVPQSRPTRRLVIGPGATTAGHPPVVTRNGLAELRKLTHNYYSATPVRIDGLDFDPQPGAVIVVVPALDLVASDNASVMLDGFPILSAGVLDL